ncbi:ArnT family glycosyltransferase [Neisseriaceae bacterium B1]
MLTYQAKLVSAQSEATREYPWALLLMAFAWLWPGVFSHDLWNPGEPKLWQVMEQFARQETMPPMWFETPFFEVAPVYIWLATVLLTLFSPWAMDGFAAARLASVAFAAIGLISCGMAGFRLLGRHQGRLVVLVLLGSVGLLPLTHFLSGFSVVFAAVGLLFWAFALSRKQLVMASVLGALGLVLLFQSGGLIMPLAVALVGLMLWRHPAWHETRFGVFLLASWLLAVPLAAMYPMALWLRQPEMFALYWGEHVLGVFGGMNNMKLSFSLPYFMQHVLWFAFPALPLAGWTLSRGNVWRQAYGALALCWLAVFGLILTLLPEQHQDWLVFLLVPLALLGAAQLDALRRGAAAFLNWFGGMTFGLAAVFLWLGFVAMNFGFPAKLAERAAYFSPYYTRDLDILPIVFATLFTPLWIGAMMRRRIRGRQAVTNWAAGTTLVWALLLTLFLPWLDAAKSYRPVVQQMQSALPEQIRMAVTKGKECVLVSPDDRTTRMAWLEYGTLRFSTNQAEQCRYRLAKFQSADVSGVSKIVWQGHRPRTKNEVFVLFEQ